MDSLQWATQQGGVDECVSVCVEGGSSRVTLQAGSLAQRVLSAVLVCV